MAASHASDTAPVARNPVARRIMDLKLRTKIIAIIGVMAVAAIVIGALALSRMATMDRDSQSLYEGGVLPLVRIAKVQDDMAAARRDVLNHALSINAQSKTKYEQ